MALILETLVGQRNERILITSSFKHLHRILYPNMLVIRRFPYRNESVSNFGIFDTMMSEIKFFTY